MKNNIYVSGRKVELTKKRKGLSFEVRFENNETEFVHVTDIDFCTGVKENYYQS